jgi:hypothetical protein
LHVGEHVLRDWVVGDVPGVPAEFDGAAEGAGGSVDDGFGAAFLVGGPHGAVHRVVGQAVGVRAGRGGAEDRPGVLVEDDHPVLAGGGHIDPAQCRHDEHAVDL